MTSSHPVWWEDVDVRVSRPPLQGDVDADVVVVGAGFTGLWSAWELMRRDPSLRVVILEAEHVGFGASGRNGGWASALFPVPLTAVAREYSVDHALHLARFLADAVSDLGRTLIEEGISADFTQGGTLSVARLPAHVQRLQGEIRDAHALGLSDNDVRWLSAADLEARARVSGALGALFSPHCARVHPAKLVHGLARRVEERGAIIAERSRVTRLRHHSPTKRAEVLTTAGRVRADVVVQATEAYTPALGPRRGVVPLYSLMIATEPLDDSWWARHGFEQRETFADGRHMIIYGQRTADNRVAFGGRGAPYHVGSGVDPRFDHDPRVFSALADTLRELFPEFDAAITHQWGGPLAMPRDHYPRANVDLVRGVARAGGYTGDGVTMSFVMGRQVARMILSPSESEDHLVDDILTRPPRRWEPEPLRYLGINAGLRLAERADLDESRQRPSRAARWLERLW